NRNLRIFENMAQNPVEVQRKAIGYYRLYRESVDQAGSSPSQSLNAGWCPPRA
ncbi:unnamed protein product, partial [Ilex paraguariensis]